MLRIQSALFLQIYVAIKTGDLMVEKLWPYFAMLSSAILHTSNNKENIIFWMKYGKVMYNNKFNLQ